jgi:hypothetical protein
MVVWISSSIWISQTHFLALAKHAFVFKPSVSIISISGFAKACPGINFHFL